MVYYVYINWTDAETRQETEMYMVLVDGFRCGSAKTLTAARRIFNDIRDEVDASQIVELEDPFGNRVCFARGFAY